MADINELKDRRAKCISDAQAVLDDAGDTPLSQEKRALVDSLLNEADGLKENIERMQRVEATRAVIVEAEPRKTDPIITPEVRITTTPDDAPWTRAYRTGKLTSFSDNAEGKRGAYEAGMWLRSRMFGDTRANRWCAEHMAEYRALSEGVNTAGGWLVPTELSRAVINLREDYGVFRQNCRVIPMGSDRIDIPRRAGGNTAYFVSENSALTESDTSWGQVTLNAKKLACMTRMSTEVAEDAVISLADWVASEMALAFATKEDQCGFIGTGAATYGGITGAAIKLVDGNHTAGAIDAATAAHDTFAEIDATDIAGVIGKIPTYARKGAKIFCSPLFFDTVLGRLMAAGGGNTIANLEGGYGPRYMGMPIVLTAVMPGATPTTDYSDVCMALFGDLSLAATMGDRRGFTLRVADQRYAEYDQVALIATERFDIVVHDLGDTTNPGPIVGLVGPT